MSALSEANTLVKQLAEPRPAGEYVSETIRRVRVKLGVKDFSRNRVKDIWYQDSRISLSGDELNKIRRAAGETSDDPEIAELRAQLAHAQKLLAALAARTRFTENQEISRNSSR